MISTVNWYNSGDWKLYVAWAVGIAALAVVCWIIGSMVTGVQSKRDEREYQRDHAGLPGHDKKGRAVNGGHPYER